VFSVVEVHHHHAARDHRALTVEHGSDAEWWAPAEEVFHFA
jgi:hypothetical protein